MRGFALAAVIATGAAGCAAWAVAPEEVEPRALAAGQEVARLAVLLWDGVAANPGPVVLAAAGFLLTVLYHAARGKSLREALDVTVTKVHVPLSAAVAGEPEAGVTRRAKLRATRNQLLSDQAAIQARLRKLPQMVEEAERAAAVARKDLADAKVVVAELRARLTQYEKELRTAHGAKAQIADELTTTRSVAARGDRPSSSRGDSRV
jgi:hypothetical protein